MYIFCVIVFFVYRSAFVDCLTWMKSRSLLSPPLFADALEPNETTPYHTRLCLERMQLGPGGTRALCFSLLGLNLSLQPAHHNHHDKKGGNKEPKDALPPLLTACYRPLTVRHIMQFLFFFFFSSHIHCHNHLLLIVW
jgi:hypothetical protein